MLLFIFGDITVVRNQFDIFLEVSFAHIFFSSPLNVKRNRSKFKIYCFIILLSQGSQQGTVELQSCLIVLLSGAPTEVFLTYTQNTCYQLEHTYTSQEVQNFNT